MGDTVIMFACGGRADGGMYFCNYSMFFGKRVVINVFPS